MEITVEATYEDGVLRLAKPLPQLAERATVRVTVEIPDGAIPAVSVIAFQRRRRLRVSPENARRIADDHEFDAIHG